ncbi:hypothetical protein [Psychrobacter sp. SWN149]|uniref:hypothetical protein n=1 Tax=Psychrobacter sp. SWN149 TaxID=2792057 RepID=UPI0018CDEAE4|nr:hypothetical protein [Psychrobacter sp. SWN149]MBH0005568.1 hypothetical protein [Psychrobacter sp. SWN149]
MSENVDLNEIREKIAKHVDWALDRKIPLPELQATFRGVKRTLSARNGEGLKTKLNSEFDLDKLSKLKEELEKLLKSHIFFDDKLISVYYEVDVEETTEKLLEFFKNNLSECPENEYHPIEQVKLSDSVSLFQFSIVREISVRDILDPDDLIESISEEYQQLIGIKKIPLACYDLVICDTKNNYVVVAMDLASVLSRSDLNLAYINFNNYLDKDIGIVLTNACDFFPKIQELYEEKTNKNGVTEIVFMTPHGTTHDERLKGNQKDLRDATYHDEGTKAVRNEKVNGKLLGNNITPYRISMRYYRDNRNLDTSLKSSYQAIHAANGSHLYEAYIYGTRNIDELNFILGKLT